MAEHMLRTQVSSSCKANYKKNVTHQNGSPLNIRTVHQISMKTTFQKRKKVMVQELVNTSMIVEFYFIFFLTTEMKNKESEEGAPCGTSPQDEVILAGKNRNLSLLVTGLEGDAYAPLCQRRNERVFDNSSIDYPKFHCLISIQMTMLQI